MVNILNVIRAITPDALARPVFSLKTPKESAQNPFKKIDRKIVIYGASGGIGKSTYASMINRLKSHEDEYNKASVVLMGRDPERVRAAITSGELEELQGVKATKIEKVFAHVGVFNQETGKFLTPEEIDSDQAKGIAHKETLYVFDRAEDTWVGRPDFLQDTDVFITTAGAPRKPGMTRADLLKANLSVAISVADLCNKWGGDSIKLFLNVANPANQLNYVYSQELENIDPRRIISVGAGLDTIRAKQIFQDLLMRPAYVEMVGLHNDKMEVDHSIASIKWQGKSVPMYVFLEAPHTVLHGDTPQDKDRFLKSNDFTAYTQYFEKVLKHYLASTTDDEPGFDEYRKRQAEKAITTATKNFTAEMEQLVTAGVAEVKDIETALQAFKTTIADAQHGPKNFFDAITAKTLNDRTPAEAAWLEDHKVLQDIKTALAANPDKETAYALAQQGFQKILNIGLNQTRSEGMRINLVEGHSAQYLPGIRLARLTQAALFDSPDENASLTRLFRYQGQDGEDHYYYMGAMTKLSNAALTFMKFLPDALRQKIAGDADAEIAELAAAGYAKADNRLPDVIKNDPHHLSSSIKDMPLVKAYQQWFFNGR